MRTSRNKEEEEEDDDEEEEEKKERLTMIQPVHGSSLHTTEDISMSAIY
jgi:hypothetical protein